MKTKTVTLSHIEFLTLAAATMKAAVEGRDTLPPVTIHVMEELAMKALDIAESIQGGALSFNIGILEPGEEVPKTEAEEILDAMKEGLKLEVAP